MEVVIEDKAGMEKAAKGLSAVLVDETENETAEEKATREAAEASASEEAEKAEAARIAAEKLAAGSSEDDEEGTEDDEEGEDGDDESNVVTYLAEKFGEVDELEELAKSNNIDGAVKYIEKLKPKIGLEAIGTLFESFPELQSLHQHLQEGLSSDTWKESVKPSVYENYTIPEKDEAAALNILRKAAEVRGLNEKQVSRIITAAKDEATLFEDANEELAFLKENEKASRQQVIDKEKRSIKEKEDREILAFKQAEEKVLSGSFAGIQLDETTKKEFYQTFAYRGKAGNEPTKLDKYYSEITVEDQLFLDLMLTFRKEGKFEEKAKGLFKPASKKPSLGADQRKGPKLTGGESNDGEKLLSPEAFNNLFKRKKG
jgi:hypothetical protein